MNEIGMLLVRSHKGKSQEYRLVNIHSCVRRDGIGTRFGI